MGKKIAKNYLVNIVYYIDEGKVEIREEPIQVNECYSEDEAKQVAEERLKALTEVYGIESITVKKLPKFDVYAYNTAIYHCLELIPHLFYITDKEILRKLREDIESLYKPIK